MPSERIDLFGSHYQQDNCNTFLDLRRPLDILKIISMFTIYKETARNFRKYGLYGFRFRGIAQEGLKNIQEFIKQGGTQVEHPLVLTPPIILDPNNYPLGTYIKVYVDMHLLFSPKTPDFILKYALEKPPTSIYSIQIREIDYITAQSINVGVITESPDPNKKFVVYSYGPDQQILQGRHGYNSTPDPYKIGEWYHTSIQGPNVFDFGVRLDTFGLIPKIEILKSGETETERVPAGKIVFAHN